MPRTIDTIIKEWLHMTGQQCKQYPSLQHSPSILPSLCLSHTHRQVTAATAATVLHSLKKKASDYGVIGIDEGQFVSDDGISNSCHVLCSCCLINSFQILLNFVRRWLTQERQLLWQHLMALSKERYTPCYMQTIVCYSMYITNTP